MLTVKGKATFHRLLDCYPCGAIEVAFWRGKSLVAGECLMLELAIARTVR